MPWLIARFQPVGLFSLKHGEATSTGGKSLLTPTPFALRMALLDAAIRVEGMAGAEEFMETIRALKIALQPARYAAVSGLFGKILKPARDKASQRAMTPTIAFREYVHFWDEFALAFQGESDALQMIARWLPHITSLGKRGSFVQLLSAPQMVHAEATPEGFVLLQGADLQSGPLPPSFALGILQRLDEWGASLSFEKANVFDEAKIKMGQDRLRMDVVLPYQLVHAGRGFTLYQKIG